MTTTIKKRVYYRDLLPLSVKKLFGDTYWAKFKVDTIDTIEKVTQLSNNRELIANRYNLKHTNAKYPGYLFAEFQVIDKNRFPIADHTEVYKNKDNDWVIIQSPYGCLDNQNGGIEKQQYFIDKGYTIIEPIYSYDATSFIKVIPKKRR